MGKIILCTGRITDEAFLFPGSNTRIYSIEELCYYIYSNIYSLSEDDFKIEMTDWIERNLQMPITASKLRKMIRKKESLKDMVVTILCSADYYEEDEIKKLIRVMDKLENSSQLERMKLRADNFLKNREFNHAQMIYCRILEEKEEQLQEIFLGNVFHNLGIAKIHTSSYTEAADCFQKAYKKNKKEDSFIAYLLCLKLAKKEELLSKEKTNGLVDAKIVSQFLDKIEKTMEEAKMSTDYQDLGQLKDSKGAKQMITQWKDEFKNGLI